MVSFQPGKTLPGRRSRLSSQQWEAWSDWPELYALLKRQIRFAQNIKLTSAPFDFLQRQPVDIRPSGPPLSAITTASHYPPGGGCGVIAATVNTGPLDPSTMDWSLTKAALGSLNLSQQLYSCDRAWQMSWRSWWKVWSETAVRGEQSSSDTTDASDDGFF